MGHIKDFSKLSKAHTLKFHYFISENKEPKPNMANLTQS